MDDTEPNPPGLALIDIGTRLKGSIVATNADGVVPAVRIGLASKAMSGDFQEGFQGSRNPPASPPQINNPTFIRNPTDQQPDSMIRASVIGSLRISNANIGDKGEYWPRIESPSIGLLDIGVATPREGQVLAGYAEQLVVWSGLLELDPLDETRAANDFTNDFATVGSVSMKCSYRYADFWISTDQLQATHNFGGVIHSPALSQAALYRFGGFGQFCTDTVEPIVITSITELSPRNSAVSAAYPKTSLRITQAQGLSGQVIIGGSADVTASGQWLNSIYVGSPNIESPDEDAKFGVPSYDPLVPSDHVAPYYLATSASLRGGAIGEVPFNLHPIDTVPQSVGEPGRHVAPSDLTAPDGSRIRLSHYGPVTFDPLWAPLSMETRSFQGGLGRTPRARSR